MLPKITSFWQKNSLVTHMFNFGNHPLLVLIYNWNPRNRSPCDWCKMTLHPGSLRYSSTWWSRSSARRPEMASCCTNGVPAGTYYTRRWAVPIFCQKNLAAMQAPWTTWIIWMRSWIPTNTLLSSENAQKMIQFSQNMSNIYTYLEIHEKKLDTRLDFLFPLTSVPSFWLGSSLYLFFSVSQNAMMHWASTVATCWF